jgi:hypothetical protein
MEHVDMSRDREGLTPVPKDRGVKKKKGAEKGWEETGRRMVPTSIFCGSEVVLRVDGRKKSHIHLLLPSGRSVWGDTGLTLIAQIGLSRGV